MYILTTFFLSYINEYVMFRIKLKILMHAFFKFVCLILVLKESFMRLSDL